MLIIEKHILFHTSNPFYVYSGKDKDKIQL